ncbi:hypothetical protein FRC16_001093 [Serendipita sp. 398]|nr:hypothetical protein FRC16_001093 [Serendipita sp. 398]
MSVRQLSRPTTPASSIKGLGPFRTPRSRPSLSLASSSTVAAGLHVDSANSEHQAGTAATTGGHRGPPGARTYRHRKSASQPQQPQQPLPSPKPRWQHSSSTVVPYSEEREGQSQQHSSHHQQHPPVSNLQHFARPSFAAGAQTAIRSSLQSLARSGSFSLLKTPKQPQNHLHHKRNNSDQSGAGSIYHYSKYNSDFTHDDLDAVSDGSRFDLLDSDPFRSESPAPVVDIIEGTVDVDIDDRDDTPPPVPPKPLPLHLQIAAPPVQTVTSEPEDNDADDETQTDGSRTPTVVTSSMKQAFSRITGGTNGRSRIRLLSFIKEVRSPIAEPEPPVVAAPQLTLPTFQTEGPLFDASKFDINDFTKSPAHQAGDLFAFPSARTPTIRGAPSLVDPDHNTSALQLNLHGDIESYMIPSPVEPEEHREEQEEEEEEEEVLSDSSTGIAIIAPTPPSSAVTRQSVASKVAPEWISEFREELERLAGEALNMTSFSDRLVLELPPEGPGGRRRTLIFQEAEPLNLMPEIVEEEPQEEATPALTSDSVSITSAASTASTTSSRPPKPTRPIPQIPIQEVMDSGVSEFERFWRREAERRMPHGYNEANGGGGGGRVESLYTIKSHSTFDPTQTIPSIPDQDSYFGTITDDEDEVRTIRSQPANDLPELPPVPSVSISPPPPPFQPRLSKQEAIEEAIRKIQRKAQEKRISLSVTSEEEEESDEEEENGPKTPQQTSFQPEKFPGNLSIFRTASNPFVTQFESTIKRGRPQSLDPPPKHRKVSLLRKRVLSRSIGGSRSDSGHSRSFSEPTESSESLLKEKNIVVAGRLPLTSRSPERLVPILKTPVTAPSTTTYFPHHHHTFPVPHGFSHQQQQSEPNQPPPAFSYEDYFNPPIYLAASTPTFEVIPPAVKRNNSSSAAVYYPVDPVSRSPSYRRPSARPSPSDLVVEL